jgi:hypothetical protein
MRKLTLIITVVLFLSCGNKKAEIVERIKSYKDSVNVVERGTLGLTLDDRKKYEELYYTNGDLDNKKVRDSELRKQYIGYQAKIEDQKFQLKIKKADFQNIIDSLELELKKY